MFAKVPFLLVLGLFASASNADQLAKDFIHDYMNIVIKGFVNKQCDLTPEHSFKRVMQHFLRGAQHYHDSIKPENEVADRILGSTAIKGTMVEMTRVFKEVLKENKTDFEKSVTLFFDDLSDVFKSSMSGLASIKDKLINKETNPYHEENELMIKQYERFYDILEESKEAIAKNEHISDIVDYFITNCLSLFRGIKKEMQHLV